MANTTKVQPGLEAETAVIGALLISPEIVKDVLFTVREQDFGIEINRKIFRAARDLYLRAKPVTPVTIRDRVGKESSEYLAQLLYLRRKLRSLRDNGAVDVPDRIAVLADNARHLAQQLYAVRAEKTVVIVREKLADIAKCSGAEQRVHQCMGKHIRVRMAEQPLFIRYLDPAEDQLPPFDELMHIIPMPYSHSSLLCSL